MLLLNVVHYFLKMSRFYVMLLFCIILFIYLFIFDCSGSSLLCRLFFGCGGWRLLSGCRARVLLVTSGVAEHGLQGKRASVVAASEL